MDEFVELDVIGALEGCDKSSSVRYAWDYLRHYEALLADYRHAPINMIEIGVNHGESMRMWRWFFTQAHVVGIDINPDCRSQAGPRVTVEIGSQTDTAFLDQLCDRFPPTIVLDDGSHDYAHMIASFEHLLPRVAPGGLYIVEDVSFHSGPGLKARNGKPNVPEYFLDVARACFAYGALAPQHGQAPSIVDMVDRVTFIGHAVVLHKRDPIRDLSRGTRLADTYLAPRQSDADMAGNYAEWLLFHDGPNEPAMSATETALAKYPDRPRVRLLRAAALLRAGESDAARSILDSVVASAIKNPAILLMIADLQSRLGDVAAARETARSSLRGENPGIVKRRRLEGLANT